MSRKKAEGILARVDFPLYALQMLTSRHVLVAGGGGSSKTGVANGFEIFEISHDGQRFVAEEVMRYETGSNVVMNCAVRATDKKTYIVAGQDSHCQIYNVNVRMVDQAEMRRGSFKAENGLIRRRRRTVSENENISKKDKNSNTMEKRINFDIRPGDSVQTDFGEERDRMQRVVRINGACTMAATGGTDGHLRLWAFPAMHLKHDLPAHTKEIDDLDWSACGQLVVTCAKDGAARVWCARTGRALAALQPRPPNGTKYLFKRCRFGAIEDGCGGSRVFTVANPVGRTGRQRGLLQAWPAPAPSDASPSASPAPADSAPSTGPAPSRTVLIEESLSALAVRNDGRFLAVGTMFSGSIHIYIAFSLQRVLEVRGAHQMFVTGVEFLPAPAPGGSGKGGSDRAGSELLALATRSEAALLSISIDNKLVLHTLPYRSTMPAWVAIVLIIFVLFCTFTLCSYLGI